MKYLRMTLLGLVILGPAVVLGAAEEWEAENHFRTIIMMIDRNLRLPAQRQMAVFKEAGYPKGSIWLKGLEFGYAKRFRNLSPDEAERQSCATTYKELKAELEGMSERLPPAVAQLVESDAGPIDDIANLILNRMNPDAPPPKLKLKERDALELCALIQELITAADQQLDASMKEIKDEKFEFDDSTDEGMAKIKEATFRRYKFANTFYTAYRVAREVIEWSEKYGLDPVKSKETLERWMHLRLQKCANDLGSWEWIYAPFYPFLRHRLNVLRGEIVRLNVRRSDLGEIKANDTSYSEVKDALVETTSINTKDYAKAGAEVVRAIELLKLQAWADLLQLHLMLGEDKYLDFGIEMFENDFLNRKYTFKYPKNAAMEAAVGHVYLVAQRLYHARQNAARRDELLAQLSASKNFFAPNASLWIQWYIGDPKGGSSYEKPPVAVVAKLGVSMASRLWVRGRDEVDEKKAHAVKLQALVNMRNALKGLPPAGEAGFFEAGPELYQSYAYYLYALGWYHQAVVVARDGLSRFKPYWKSPTDNSWIGREGTLSKEGHTVAKLSGNLLSYVLALRNRAPGPATDGYFNEAVDLLKIYNPEKAKDLDWYQIIIYLNNDQYDQALRMADEYLSTHPKQQAKVIGIIALIRYKAFAKAKKLANDRIDDPKVAVVLKQADESVKAAWDVIAPVAQGKRPAPKGQEKEYQKQYRNLIGIKVAIAFQKGDYSTVLADLDEDFWKVPPEDLEMNQNLLLYMANAIYKIIRDAREQNKINDPQHFTANWPHYAFVMRQFAAALKRHPELADETRDHRKAMGQVFWVAHLQADKFSERAKAKDPALAEFKETDFAGISQMALEAYAEVMERIIDDSTKPKVVISVADSLWNLGKKERAAELYEIYKGTLDKNLQVKRFKQNPTTYLNDVKKTFSVRTELKPFFVNPPTDRGTIQDLLLDKKDFIDKIYKLGRKQDEWTEEKADYGKAFLKIAELRKAFDKIKRRVVDKEGMEEAMVGLEELAHGLVSTVRVNSRLIEVYRDQGGEHMKKAVELARDLYDYDPRSISYRSFYIQGVIQDLQEPPYPDDRQVKAARGVAIELRRDTAKLAKYMKEYWLSVCQIMEMSAYLKEADLVQRSLENNLMARKSPAYDLSVPGSEPMRAGDKAAVEICRRYLKLFDIHGVTLSKPYSIETGKDGTVYFLEGDQTLEEAEKAREEEIRKAQEAAKAAAEGEPPPDEEEKAPAEGEEEKAPAEGEEKKAPIEAGKE